MVFFSATARSSGYSLRRGKMILFIGKGNQIENRTTPKIDKRTTPKDGKNNAPWFHMPSFYHFKMRTSFKKNILLLVIKQELIVNCGIET
jgi:hypothetical protein